MTLFLKQGISEEFKHKGGVTSVKLINLGMMGVKLRNVCAYNIRNPMHFHHHLQTLTNLHWTKMKHWHYFILFFMEKAKKNIPQSARFTKRKKAMHKNKVTKTGQKWCEDQILHGSISTPVIQWGGGRKAISPHAGLTKKGMEKVTKTR